MTYFAGCADLDALKARYRELALAHHPDRGGDTRTMQEINEQYERAINRLDLPEDLRDLELDRAYRWTIDALIALDALTIEIVGSWIWVDGETYRHRAALKKIGLFWSKNKQKWYWRPATHKHRRKGGRTLTYGEILDRHPLLARIETDRAPNRPRLGGS